MANHFDVTLKHLFHTLPVRLTELLVQARAVEFLNTEFPSVRSQFPDLLLRLDNNSIFHAELIANNDQLIQPRGLRYRLDASERYPNQRVVQAGLYVGYEPMRMPERIEEEDLSYRFRLYDLRQFEAEWLLGSPSRADQILAFLCGTKDLEETARRIIRGWAGAGREQVAQWTRSLLILSKLRRAEVIIEKELRAMPITVNLLEHEVLRDYVLKGVEEGREEGRLEGRVEGREEGRREGEQHARNLLLLQLEHRFGQLPAWVHDRVRVAQTATLDDWSLRLLEAGSIEDLFGQT